MISKRLYVIGFLGRRDAYQIPLALQEGGMLSGFVTGAYCKKWHVLLMQRLGISVERPFFHRTCKGLCDSRILSRWRFEFLQHMSRVAGDRSNRSWRWANRSVSYELARQARRSGSNLFAYEPYAWEAFNARYSHNPRKILFHFHIHPVFEREIISNDCSAHPVGNKPWLRTDADPADERRVVDAWRVADLVLCASSFTKQSLVANGMPENKAFVIPYGIDIAAETAPRPAPAQFHALFVGSGIQRKGIHHLLLAWNGACMPPGSTLTLVCRFMDPALEELLEDTPDGVQVVRGMTSGELSELFSSSSLFVMPSLVEGFGQVFLEALACGCPVLGTDHTCLPDLGGEEDGVFIVPAGNIECLREKLELLASKLVGQEALAVRSRALTLARGFTWKRFREKIVEAVRSNKLRE
jgi:glycosyltransferase involved in cell wall biosynthesis